MSKATLSEVLAERLAFANLLLQEQPTESIPPSVACGDMRVYVRTRPILKREMQDALFDGTSVVVSRVCL